MLKSYQGGSNNKLTDKQVKRIYEYCIGGNGGSMHNMRVEVNEFMKRDDVTLEAIGEYIGEIDQVYHRERELLGYYDY